MPGVKTAYGKARHTQAKPALDEPDDPEQDSWKIDDPIAAYDAAMRAICVPAKPRKPTKHQGGYQCRVRRERECRLEPADKPSVEEMQRRHSRK